MKAVRVTAQADGVLDIAPLPLQAIQRRGVASADAYRRQAAGEPAGIDFNPNISDAVRTIAVSDGRFDALASHPGALLTFVISGELTVDAAPGKTVTLVPGDILFTDEQSARTIAATARNRCRLVQIGVPAQWPGANAEIQGTGTINPREGAEPKIKRIYKGVDEDKAYFEDFTELFPVTPDRWSDPHPVTGFRILRWEGGSMDYHPCVTNQLAIVSAGEMQQSVGGGGGASEVFRAGDICLAVDRTGEGHQNTVRGTLIVTVMVLETEHLW
jgi:hypothetical protein